MGGLINSNKVRTNVNHRHSCDAWNECNIPRAVVVNLRSHSSRKLYHDRPWYIIHLFYNILLTCTHQLLAAVTTLCRFQYDVADVSALHRVPSSLSDSSGEYITDDSRNKWTQRKWVFSGRVLCGATVENWLRCQTCR